MGRPRSTVTTSLLVTAVTLAAPLAAQPSGEPEDADPPADLTGDAVEVGPALPSQPATPPATARADIVLVGDDPRLVGAVAAELRAAGLRVTVLSGMPGPGPAGGAPVVRLERRGDSVVVHTAVTIGGGARSQLRASDDGDGLAAGDATALRVAEAIRLSVAPSPEPADESQAAAPEEHRPRVPSRSRADATPDEETAPPAMPVLRGVVLGGGGVNPEPAVVLGGGLRGQITPRVNASGLVLATGSMDPGDHAEAPTMQSVKLALMASWEVLGATSSWSPAVGGGLVWEYRWWEKLTYEQGVPVDTAYEGGQMGLGYAVMAGIRSGPPFRFRFDVYADVRSQSWEVHGSGHHHPDVEADVDATLMATVGADIDFYSRPVMTHRATNHTRRW